MLMNRTILLLLVFGLVLGCTGAPQAPASDTPAAAQPAVNDSPSGASMEDTSGVMENTSNATADTSDTVDGPAGTAPSGSGKEVLILGRSVAYGWMEYLGGEYVCQDEECATGTVEADYQGYHFIYSEIDIPPQVATSAVERVDLYGDDADTVFFKLCFDDFESDESMENAARNENYVKYVYDEAVTKRGKKLIVGNALPKVEEYTDSDLTANHRAYNSWLNDFASTHDGIKVLDLYGILSTDSGNMNMAYASDQYDSHPNSAGYAKITPEFMKLLD
jgi:hypothetical protein